jgi:hypothetical protein
MQFNFEVYQKNSRKWKKLTKYNKKIKIRPNFSKKFQTMFEGLVKNWDKKQKNKKYSPSAVVVALGEEMLPRVRDGGKGVSSGLRFL